MRSSTPLWLVVIAAVTILAVWMDLPNNPGLLGRPIEARPGLDIQGGLRVLLSADAGAAVNADSLDQARQIVAQRVNALGVAEPVVQVYGTDRIEVELPGIRDPKAAIATIQQTGLLEFVDFSKTGACTATFPAAGQYILTDRQLQLRNPQAAVGTGTPALTATTGAGTPQAVGTAPVGGTAPALIGPAATAGATLNSGAILPIPSATVNVSAPTSLPTNVPNSNFKFAPAQATTAATAQATTAVPTSVATSAASLAATAAATRNATSSATGAATLSATLAATAPATALPLNGSTKAQAAINPCTGQPFSTIMDGSGLQTAAPELGGTANNEWVVSFTLADNDEGHKFGPFTGAHIGQPMAIVLDGQVLSAPTIQAALTTGGQITGGFTQAQANDLGLQLKYGALPVPLHVESEEQVGASLGAESVAATGRAGVLGVGIILIFMIVLYRVPGVLAALALLLFAAINFALYKFIPVTLTLPAITGFLISIGTAVDGNILIFERIKEELRLGRTLEKAIEVGFSRAWPSIRDSNISTLMVGFILYFFGSQFGAGSVRGFAITLILGLATNLFTAVIVTRTLLDVALVTIGGALRRNKWMIGL